MPTRIVSPPPPPSPVSADPPVSSPAPGWAVHAASVRAPTAASAAIAVRDVIILVSSIGDWECIIGAGWHWWLAGRRCRGAHRQARSVGEDLAEEVLGAIALRMVEERVRLGLLHDLPFRHEHHAVGGLAGES